MSVYGISIQFLLLLTLILVGYFAIVGAGKKAGLELRGGGLLAAARTVYSAPSFLVPTAMAGVALFALTVSSKIGGQNPWLADDDGILFQGAALVIVALCVAGHVGLLEARKAGRAPESEDFLQGIQRHGWTFLLAKLAWAGAIVLPLGATSQSRFYRLISLSDAESVWAILMFLAPSFLLAPVLATASTFPGKPVRALASAIVFVVRNPWAVARLVALQFGIGVLGVAIMEAGPATARFALSHASPLGFQVYAYIPIARGTGAEEVVATALMALTAPVFLTAYWALANGDVTEALERRPVGAPKRAAEEA